MAKKNFPGFKYVKSSAGIEEFELKSNGLRVLIMEDHSSPTATLMVTYHVGSRNEAVGHTGATHLLEHLMFKGSKKFHKKTTQNIWSLQNVGAEINATTWFDRTNYFEILPSRHLESALAIEADRMRHAFIKKEDLDSEMTVVRNEFERGENYPLEALDKAIWATAFVAHPYHHSTIGWRSDIENVGVERLKKFYDTFYWPNNATVSCIGDIEKSQALKLIKKHFGQHQASASPIPPMYTSEPPQEGERRVEIRRAGQNPILAMAFKIPQGRSPEIPAIQLLAAGLCLGRSSRLYKALIDRGLGSDLNYFSMPLHDPGLFIIYLTLTDEVLHQKAEKIIWREINKIKQKGIKEKELSRVKKMLTTSIAYSRDGSYLLASSLNETIAAGDWTIFTRLPEMIKKVAAEEVKTLANKYLKEDQSTIGWFVPKQNENSRA